MSFTVFCFHYFLEKYICICSPHLILVKKCCNCELSVINSAWFKQEQHSSRMHAAHLLTAFSCPLSHMPATMHAPTMYAFCHTCPSLPHTPPSQMPPPAMHGPCHICPCHASLPPPHLPVDRQWKITCRQLRLRAVIMMSRSHFCS